MTNHSVLNNLRILDFTWVLAGPYATRLLADFGAEVIKVNSPAHRIEGVFEQAYFDTWNRNKLGITLDLNKPEGLAIARRLIEISDAVVENFSPRVMENWGLDYANLKKIKPDIIMLSLSAFGHSGQWRDYVGFGPTVQAFSGMTYLTSFPGEPPTGPGFSYADHVAALMATLALLGALEQRWKTGEGQYIDVSEVEAMDCLVGEAIEGYGVTGKEVQPTGNASADAAPHGVYRCRGEDRWVAIAVFNEDEWKGFQQTVDLPWTKQRRFATLAGRRKNAAELDRLIEAWTKSRTAKTVMNRLQKCGVAAGMVQDAKDLAHDPQLKARGSFVESQGKALSDASPIRLSDTPAKYSRAAPSLGQDNDYVYRKLLGMGKREIDGLKKKGVI